MHIEQGGLSHKARMCRRDRRLVRAVLSLTRHAASLRDSGVYHPCFDDQYQTLSGAIAASGLNPKVLLYLYRSNRPGP